MVRYETWNKNGEPEDYPMTNGGYLLVSDKIERALRQVDANIQYLPARIQKKSGKIYDNFWTLNVLDVISCTDFGRSKVRRTPLPNGGEIVRILKLFLDERKIPAGKKIFRLGEQKTWLIVHQDIVDLLSPLHPVGLKFIPVEKFNCI